jgi:hypothetical protein
MAAAITMVRTTIIEGTNGTITGTADTMVIDGSCY